MNGLVYGAPAPWARMTSGRPAAFPSRTQLIVRPSTSSSGMRAPSRSRLALSLVRGLSGSADRRYAGPMSETTIRASTEDGQVDARLFLPDEGEGPWP